MSNEPQPGDNLIAMLTALPINPRNLDQLRAIRAETTKLIEDRDSWRRELDLYAGSWLRNLGGKLFNKRHRIDAYAMTTEQMRVGFERAKAAGLIGETFHREGPDYGEVRVRIAAARMAVDELNKAPPPSRWCEFHGGPAHGELHIVPDTSLTFGVEYVYARREETFAFDYVERPAPRLDAVVAS